MFLREVLWLDPGLWLVSIFVSSLISANLILLGLIDVIGAAINSIDVAMKSVDLQPQVKDRQAWNPTFSC